MLPELSRPDVNRARDVVDLDLTRAVLVDVHRALHAPDVDAARRVADPHVAAGVAHADVAGGVLDADLRRDALDRSCRPTCRRRRARASPAPRSRDPAAPGCSSCSSRGRRAGSPERCTSFPLRTASSLMSASNPRLDARAVPRTRTSVMSARPVTRSCPARASILSSVAPARVHGRVARFIVVLRRAGGGKATTSAKRGELRSHANVLLGGRSG